MSHCLNKFYFYDYGDAKNKKNLSSIFKVGSCDYMFLLCLPLANSLWRNRYCPLC